MNALKIHIIAGPTASGKSALALELAEKTGGVIINADSQQMYRELRILTARPTEEEEARVPHRLYGALPAHEPCSAGKWLRFAKMEIDWALGEGRPAIVVGGTGLYLRALTDGIAEIPDIPPEVRNQARSDLEAMGKAAFYERLKSIDPEDAVNILPSDAQRMTRAYEVFLATGKALSRWHKESNISFYDKSLFTIQKVEIKRDELYRRCDLRFEAMVNSGAIEEVKKLLTLHLPPDAPAMKIIGVPELASYLRGECTLEEATIQAKQATRNYAKRQMTWFRNQLVL